MSRLAWPFVRSRTTLASRSSRNARSRAVRVRDAPRAHFSLLPSRSARADLRPTPRRPRADRPPTCPRLPRPVRVVLTAQTRHEAPTVLALALVPKLVDKPRPARPAVHEQVLELLQAPQMHLQLRVPPAGLLAHLASREAHVARADALRPRHLRHHHLHEMEQPSRHRRKLVEAPTEHLVGQSVRDRDVLPRRLHVFHPPPRVLHTLHLTLVLMQKRHRSDQRQVLHVIPPRPRSRIHEAQLLRVRIHDGKRPQEPLRVLLHLLDPPLALPREKSLQRLRPTLPPMDRLRLFPSFVHRQHETSIEQLLVHLDRRRRQEDPDGPCRRCRSRRRSSRKRDESADGRGARGGAGAAARSEASRARRGRLRAMRSGRRGNEQAGWVSHRRVDDALLFRDEAKNRIHQTRFPRRARALDHHRQRLFELPTRRRQQASWARSHATARDARSRAVARPPVPPRSPSSRRRSPSIPTSRDARLSSRPRGRSPPSGSRARCRCPCEASA